MACQLCVQASGMFPGSGTTIRGCWTCKKKILGVCLNLAVYAVQIPVGKLPSTFRDAIQVCKELGIHLIWRDSFCILLSGQDSKAEWILHISENAQHLQVLTSQYRSRHGIVSPRWAICITQRGISQNTSCAVREGKAVRRYPYRTLFSFEV
jgi:hypothetical protein